MPQKLKASFMYALCVLSLATRAFAQTDDPGLGDLIRLCDTERGYVERFLSVSWSEERNKRIEQTIDACEKQLASVQFEKLTRAGQIDYLLMRTDLETQRERLRLERTRLDEINALLPGRLEIQKLELSRRRREPLDVESAANALAGLPDLITKIRERIEKGRHEPAASAPATSSAPASNVTQPADGPLKVSAVVALRTARAVNDLQRTLGDWYRSYEGYQPDFDWWMKKPREAADRALGDYAKYLRETIAGVKGESSDPLIGDPIGEAALLADLRSEWIPYSPQELIAIGEREFAWCEEKMKKAAAELGCGEDWKAALAKAKAAHVPPGQQDELVIEEARNAVAFLKKNDLITIPPAAEEMWRVEMLSAETQKSLPYAVYGGQYVGVAYPTDDMAHEDKLASMRGNNRHFVHIVTPHELIPGHHLQSYFADRKRSYRRTFSTPFFVEGWALYWEMRLWEMGYARDAADRIGMLFWRMHRCARIVVSLKFHLGQMSPTEMVDFLVDRVGHEKFGATSEVRRYIGGDYSPLYQCGYMIGGLQIRAMYNELVGGGNKEPAGGSKATDKSTNKMTDKQFNDALMGVNAIPIELARLELMKALPLSATTRANWKFAGEANAMVLPHP